MACLARAESGDRTCRPTSLSDLKQRGAGTGRINERVHRSGFATRRPASSVERGREVHRLSTRCGHSLQTPTGKERHRFSVRRPERIARTLTVLDESQRSGLIDSDPESPVGGHSEEATSPVRSTVRRWT